MIQIREGELADRRAAMRTMPKLKPFDDKNDAIVDAFIRRFESYAVSLEWPIYKWALNLSALLHGIALDVYNRQLRTAKPERGESFGQFMTRLEGYFFLSMDRAVYICRYKVSRFKGCVIARASNECCHSEFADIHNGEKT